MSAVKGARELLNEARALLDQIETQGGMEVVSDRAAAVLDDWRRDHAAWEQWADAPAINSSSPFWDAVLVEPT